MIRSRDLEAINLEILRPYIRDSAEFYAPPGKEHYRLLAFLSTQVAADAEVFDIGTNYGDSAIALSYDDQTVVHSFDLVDRVPLVRKTRRNVHYHLENILTGEGREKWKDRLLASPLIFLDVDPHDGETEHEFVSWLEESKYQGVLVLDDIWYFKGMREKLWYRIKPEHKWDLTRLGHWSGTGIVSWTLGGGTGFSKTDHWTVVTGFFDLTRRDDANQEIKNRPPNHYIEENAHSTLALDQNLVVFCEPDYKDRILAIRPKWLHERTHVVTQSFDGFPLSGYLPKIVEARGGSSGCARDPRNTASYYLFCVARFAMMKYTIRENPFGSTHFAWTNICIERMGFRNLIHFEEALAQNRSKFSTCYIDHVAKSDLSSLPAFFGVDGCRNPQGTCGRCSMCSGFFTGGLEHMYEVSDLVERKFLECLAAGYGHADEQLLALVHADRPELFEWYPGDYHEMVTNYRSVYDRADKPVRNLIRHSMEHKDDETAKRAAGLVWDSYERGACELSTHDLELLLAVLS